MFLKNIIKIFKIKDLRNRILIVLIVFVIFRIMAGIPIPGVNPEELKAFFEQFQVFGLFNVFTGGTMQNLSIVMLGLGPFITSTVVLQLLSMIFPQLERIYKEEGEAGREKFNQLGRLLSIPLAFLQGYTMLTLFQKRGVLQNLTVSASIASVISITAGTVLLMWLSEIISDKGIGNGTSLLIFAGIISSFPQNILQTYSGLQQDPSQTLSYVLFFILSLFIIFAVVLTSQAKRNIPVSYAKRVRGRKVYGGAKTFLPLNLNPAGVMPIIFALSLLTLPGMLANFFLGAEGYVGKIAQQVSNLFANPVIYSVFYFFLVLLFTFFYTLIIFDSENISQNLKNTGGFIPGYRPGKPTAKRLSFILNRILPIGASFLGVIALAPTIIGRLTGIMTFQFLVGGTSLLILVNVVVETYQEIKSFLQMQEL